MEWTKEKPTQIGLYWAFDGEEVVSIDIHDSYVDDYPFVAYESAQDYTTDMDKFTHWMGPIPKPELPQANQQ